MRKEYQKTSTHVLENLRKRSTECRGLRKRINCYSKTSINAVNIKQAIVASSVPTTVTRADIDEGAGYDDGQQQLNFII